MKHNILLVTVHLLLYLSLSFKLGSRSLNFERYEKLYMSNFLILVIYGLKGVYALGHHLGNGRLHFVEKH